MTTDATDKTSTDAGQGDADAGKMGDAGKGGEGEGTQTTLGGDAGSATMGGEQGSGSTEPKDGGAGEAELKIELPDGVNVDEKMLDGFTSVAKDAGLNSESATKVAAWYAQAVEAQSQANVQAVEDQSKAWAQELAQDADFGGANLKANINAVNAMAIKFGDQGFVEEMNAMGLAAHPGICRLLWRVSKAIGEDSTHVDTAGGGPTKNPQEAQEASLRKLYNKSQPEGSG